MGLDMVSNYKKRGGNGGKRAGAGRKRVNAPRVTYAVDVTPQQAGLLKMWGGGDVSDGVRWLVDNAAPLIGPAVATITPQPPPPTPSP